MPMPASPQATSPTNPTVTSSGVPLRIFSRLPLPQELASAIGDALEESGGPEEARHRESVAVRTRLTLEAWLDGLMTTTQAVKALRMARGR
jgi:hypothetical protein